MKNTKFKMMAIALCLAVGFAFAGCNATAEETTKEETTTTTTEATTTTTEETTTEEETEADIDDDDMGFEMPDTATADDFEVEEIAQIAQECIDNGMELYAIDADQLDVEVDPDTFIEGFTGMGGSLSVSVDTEEDESSAESNGFSMVQCAAFTSYEDAKAYADELLAGAAEEDGVEMETEETEDGFTFNLTIEVEGMDGSETIEGYVTPDGVFFFEACIAT